jgi:hypothetical protein
MSLPFKEIDNLKKLAPIFESNGVVYAGVFGSYAKGSNHDESDVDILIEFEDNSKTLLEFVELKLLLEQELQRKVDLTTKKGLNKYLKAEIISSVINIYER